MGLIIETPVGDVGKGGLLTTIRIWEPCQFHIDNPTVKRQICSCRVVFKTEKKEEWEGGRAKALLPCQVTHDPGSEGIILPMREKEAA